MSVLVDEKWAARRLGVARQTLAKWRMTARHLPFVKIGTSVRYKVEDIERFIEKQTVGASK